MKAKISFLVAALLVVSMAFAVNNETRINSSSMESLKIEASSNQTQEPQKKQTRKKDGTGGGQQKGKGQGQGTGCK